ncbi:MAG: TrmB family transcriptional regulator [Proteobacteria bacterium]|nr:TrmB family transcriptional regulator [Pseudomonadota bacterium]
MADAAAEARVIEILKSLQYTATEGRLYVALLKDSPATGYELAARSGVPRSAIYSTLKKLEARGLARAVQENPVRYVPLSPKQLCTRLKGHYTDTVNELESALDQLPKAHNAAVLWQVHGYDAVVDQATQAIDAATTSVHVSLWHREALRLFPALLAASERGVDVRVFGFTELPNSALDVYSCHIEEGSLAEYWPHRLLAIVDRTKLLVGELNDVEAAYAVVTEEPALVAMGSNNLILDLTLFGERFEVDVSPAIEGLQQAHAPIDSLIAEGAR